MPSKIVAVSSTKPQAMRSGQGLRYGNFDGVRNLPPIRTSERFSDENLWAMNNDQIFRTVCEWMESWQQWQLRALFCGIANR